MSDPDRKYAGEKPVKSLKGTPFEGFTPVQWALYLIERYGQTDGAHHKAWVLDQVARILHGTPVSVRLASWETLGKITLTEWRADTAEPPSKEYLAWVEEMRRGNAAEDEDDEYDYDEGIAP